MPSCLFCILSPSSVVDASELTVTIRDAYPVSPGHTLLIPRRHIAQLFEASDAEILALLHAARRAKAELDVELHPDGYNLGVNCGVAVGQTVPHLQLHLIPRFHGDVPDPRGGIRHCIPGKGFYTPDP